MQSYRCSLSPLLLSLLAASTAVACGDATTTEPGLTPVAGAAGTPAANAGTGGGLNQFENGGGAPGAGSGPVGAMPPMPPTSGGQTQVLPDGSAGQTQTAAGSTAGVGPETQAGSGPVPQGGTAPMAGSGPTPMAGSGPMPMAGAANGGEGCISVDSSDVSTAIPTVGIVTWSTTLGSVDNATIEFELAGGGGRVLEAPVDLSEPGYRTLLLGMKGDSKYTYRIKASGGGTSCESAPQEIETGAVDFSVPDISVSGNGTEGFIVTSAGIGSGFGGGAPGGAGGAAPAFIFDTDGDPVWWHASPPSASRARMDFEGKNMWMQALNYPFGQGRMDRVSMDGMDAETNIQGFNNAHHDFTVVPGGIVTAILHENNCDRIAERSPDGTWTTVVDAVSELYQPGNGLMGGSECHANSITYHAASDSYTMSDRNPNLYVHYDRSGSLLWQLGGANPKGTHYAGNWSVNHGHHFMDDGNIVIFNNGNSGASPVIEFSLEGSTANEVWRYAGNRGSATLGDVQRLPNGNTLVTYSNAGVIEEIAGNSPVATYEVGSCGYVIFRESLYGAPPK